MTAQACPARSRLEAYLAGTLPRSEHSELRQHAGACASCRAQLEAMAPTRVFLTLRDRQAPPDLWQALWPAVAQSIAHPAAQPRRSWPAGWWASLRLAWLAPAAVSAALCVLILQQVGAGGSGPAPARQPVALARAGEFVYLSNPQAEVTHILVPDEEYGLVQLTMIVDPGLEGAF